MRLDQEKIIARFDELIKDAERNRNDRDKVTAVDIAKLRASARHLLTLLLPGTKVYLEEWDAVTAHYSGSAPPACYEGILIAAKEDYVRGFIGDQRLFICAEVFVDFLQQAYYLLNEGYKDAAAVIAGSVLEDGLRRLCDLKRLNHGEKDTINSLNQMLYRDGAYNKLWHEELSAKAVVRNDAAHGKYTGYGKQDVNGLIEFTKRFLREFLNDQLD